jgi:predicted nucleic acid-binding protein
VNVLVDTSIWSIALRRDAPRGSREEIELRALIGEDRAVIVGPVRQEVLSGVRSTEQFRRLRDHLDAFGDLPLTQDDFVVAAECFDQCRARGVQGSNTDFLICAASIRHGVAIFTTDRDFEGYAAVLPLRLHAPR